MRMKLIRCVHCRRMFDEYMDWKGRYVCGECEQRTHEASLTNEEIAAAARAKCRGSVIR